MAEAIISSQHSAIDEALNQLCATELNNLPPNVASAIKYALQGGGKQLRGRLLLASYDAAIGVEGSCSERLPVALGDREAGFEVSESPETEGLRSECHRFSSRKEPSTPIAVRGATNLAAAVEIIHAYSLVHDDLPSMDNDDFRRGRPSLHKTFSERVATVAGVAMVPLAILAVTRGAKALRLPPGANYTIVRVLAKAAGASGMIGGQLLDLQAEGAQIGLSELEAIHKAKTGALIAASSHIGGIAAGVSGDVTQSLHQFGTLLGHAFQIVDDVLDVTSTSERLGKTAGSDVKLGKSTYPSLLGVERAKESANALVAEACGILKKKNLLTQELDRIAHFIIKREF